MLKKNKGLIIYAIIILIILITIMFIIPDSFFLGLYNKIDIPIPTSEPSEKQEFVDFETQKNNLLNNQYEYEYLLSDLMTDTYKCSGKISNTIESGTCENPNPISYTEKNKKEVFFEINTDFLSPSYIFDLIKDIEPTEENYTTLREYNYKITLNMYDKTLETEIIIYTDLNDITEIEISNAFITYIIKYSNISY